MLVSALSQKFKRLFAEIDEFDLTKKPRFNSYWSKQIDLNANNDNEISEQKSMFQFKNLRSYDVIRVAAG